MSRERILITGPGGRVGTRIVPLLREEFDLRLMDAAPLKFGGIDEEIRGDVRDPAAIEGACAGVKAVVHLAAISDEDEFYTRLLPVNLEGVYTVFEAACRAGVRKVVFASTGQTVVNYGAGRRVSPEMPVRPCTVYACTKVFGEALARYYADTHGMSMICIRLCWFQDYGSEALKRQRELLPLWCSPRDLTQLIVKSIRTDIAFGIFFGVSNNAGRYLDIQNAEEDLGYRPRDRVEDYVGSENLGEPVV